MNAPTTPAATPAPTPAPAPRPPKLETYIFESPSNPDMPPILVDATSLLKGYRHVAEKYFVGRLAKASDILDAVRRGANTTPEVAGAEPVTAATGEQP